MPLRDSPVTQGAEGRDTTKTHHYNVTPCGPALHCGPCSPKPGPTLLPILKVPSGLPAHSCMPSTHKLTIHCCVGLALQPA